MVALTLFLSAQWLPIHYLFAGDFYHSSFSLVLLLKLWGLYTSPCLIKVLIRAFSISYSFKGQLNSKHRDICNIDSIKYIDNPTNREALTVLLKNFGM